MSKAVSPVSGQVCWTCNSPASRAKDGVGACGKHLLPGRKDRKAMVAAVIAAQTVVAAPRVIVPQRTKIARTFKCSQCSKHFLAQSQFEHHLRHARRLCKVAPVIEPTPEPVKKSRRTRKVAAAVA